MRDKLILGKRGHIVRILDDRRYTGDYIGGHTEKISFKSKKTRVKPKEEWTIIENHHEPIIDKQLFESVKQIRCKRKENTHKNCFDSEGIERNVYSGLLYCGRCGNPMYKRKGTSSKTKRPDCYLCKKYSCEGKIKADNKGCIPHRIRIEYLDKIIKTYINNLISSEQFKSFVINNLESISPDTISIETKLKNKKSILEKLKKQYKQIYDDKLNEIIPDFVYQEKKQDLERNIKNINLEIKELETKIKNLNKTQSKETLILHVIDDISKNGLKRDELFEFLEKIIVFAPKEITKDKKDLYNIDDLMYNELYKNGGLFFILKNVTNFNHNQADVI